MRPPDVKRPNRAAARPGREADSPDGRIYGNHSANPRPRPKITRPYVVIVRLWNRSNEYGKYATFAEADAEVAKLRKLDFRAEWAMR
jgi:hypothetical protein